MSKIDRAEEVRLVLGESRNGMNYPIRYNPFTPRFIISDGVQELAKAAACYWLLDILATELGPKVLKAINEGDITRVLVEFAVDENGIGQLKATYADDAPPFWSRLVPFNDFPAGEWVLFEIGALEWDMATETAKNVIAILLSEH
jgi:hypothetical protein